ncbi:MAG: outer membrane protein assembly factor BamA [Candidatus Zixiibacteriota bacterium]
MRNSRLAFCLLTIFLLSASGLLAKEPLKRLKVSSVTFEGNQAFERGRLKRVMLTRPSGFLSRSYYHRHIFEDDLRSLLLFYQQNGYLEVEIADTQVTVDTTGGEVDIRIRLSEGELTSIEGVSIFGNTVFGDSVLLDRIKVKPGDPLKPARIQDASLSILTLYADNGYLEAEMKPDVRINYETHRALVDFALEEKTQFRIADIRLEGLERTKAKVVKRELLFRPGEVIKYSRLLESQRRLYLTGLFQSVFIRPQPAASGDSAEKDILIELKENESLEFNVAAGYGSVEKIRGRVEVFNSNLAGTALKAGLTLRASFIGRAAEASFTEPWTLGVPWKTDLNFLAEYLEEPGYDIFRKVGRLVVGRTFGRRSTASVAYRYEDAELSNVQVEDIPQELKSKLRTLALSLIYDTRDNLFNSTRGIYAEGRNELAGSFLSGTDTFVRLSGRLKYFHPLKRSTILATSLEIGWMDFFGTSKDIPLNERLYAGGPNSIRGFGYQLVGPLDSQGDPIGGRFQLVWNLLEIRQSIYRMIGGVLFADVGNVWLSASEFQLRDVRTSAGVGLRVNTPIGIARLDYGINLQPEEGEPGQRLYFNMGQAF